MFSKKKSKEILKFKYLLLIPVLMGMVIYTSCEKAETDNALVKVSEKRETKIVFSGYTTKEGKVVPDKTVESEKEGYFDIYIDKIPEGKAISYASLSDKEKGAFDMITGKYSGSEIYEYKNGDRAIYLKMKSFMQDKKEVDYSNASEVPFAKIDQVPVFPGCEDISDKKNCMTQKITEHVGANFDVNLSKNLGLEKGKKRVYVQFKIDKIGAVTDVKARGPHVDLEKEAIRVINLLPKMQPGEQNGEKVAVKYTLPISLVIE